MLFLMATKLILHTTRNANQEAVDLGPHDSLRILARIIARRISKNQQKDQKHQGSFNRD